jgi:hypothetical protein
MQIRKISFAFADTAIGGAHDAIAVFVFGDSLVASETSAQLQINCVPALGASHARVQEALELAKTVDFAARLGHVIVSRASHPGEATVFVVGLGPTTPACGIGAGDYQRALEGLTDFVVKHEAPIEMLTVVLPSGELYAVKRSEVARLTALWMIHSLAGPFDTKYGAYASRAKRDLDLLLVAENDGEDVSVISEQIRDGADTAQQLLAQRDQLLSPNTVVDESERACA